MAATNRNIARSAQARASGRLAEEMYASGQSDSVSAWAQSETEVEIKLAIILGAARGANTKKPVSTI